MMAALTSPVTKTLGQLLPGVAASWVSLAVTGLALDSRKARPGDLFLAYPGEHSDGRRHAGQAVAAGAVAVCAESGWQAPEFGVPVIECPGLRERVGVIADAFFDHPAAAMNLVGVTGTNGKTSCTQLLGQALRLLGRPCGVIGTLGSSLDGRVLDGGLTTPDPLALRQQLAGWRDQGVADVAMEVSSHGLMQGRVSGLRFSAAVFTNLSRDHLDFHGTMEAYGAAKARLFEQPGLGCAVINADDGFGRDLAQRLRPRLPVVTFGFGAEADVAVLRADYRADGVDATLKTPWGGLDLRSALLGDFNLANLLAVVAVLGQSGIAIADIERVAPQLKPISGRMERVAAFADIDVVVDYAHTPDALEQALVALRRHCHGALWCVFGCGGDRDQGKRPLMGEVAERLADRVVLTSDNPRGENPADILAQIQAGMNGAALVESDRAAAIELAIAQAAPGDLVLVAGKGHESYQLVGDETRPFSDIAVAQAALAARGRA